MAAGILMLARIGPDARYLTAVLPGAIVFGLGLSALVAPLTATVMASASTQLSGVASGVNNAVARTASLLAVAVLPVAAGLGGHAFADPVAFRHGFVLAMRISAVIVASGGAAAWLTIRDRLADGRPAADRSCVDRRVFCTIGAPPLERRPSLLDAK